MYGPDDLQLLEVYSFGSVIREYTFDFVEHMGRQPMALRPVFPAS